MSKLAFTGSSSESLEDARAVHSEESSQTTDLLQMALSDFHNQNVLKEQIASRFPQKTLNPENLIIYVLPNHYVEIELNDETQRVKIGKGRI